MGFFGWDHFNWFDSVQSLGIIGSFTLAYVTYRRERIARRFSNSIAITQAHRELSLFEMSNPALARVKQKEVDFSQAPATEVEIDFIALRIRHFSSCFQGYEAKELEKPDALETDVRSFFSRPLPRVVWEQKRKFQNTRFINFVERCLKAK